MPMKNPPHPGNFIRTEIIQPAGLSVTAAAAALKVSRPALSSLLNAKAELSGDMALRIEKAFGVKMDTLMRMQSSFDIARTRLRERQIHVRRIPKAGLRQFKNLIRKNEGKPQFAGFDANP
jgi:antitoxin HigA-1